MKPYVKPRVINAVCTESTRRELLAPPVPDIGDGSPEGIRQTWIDVRNDAMQRANNHRHMEYLRLLWLLGR